MQNAKCKMQNAKMQETESVIAMAVPAFAFCILHFAFRIA
jgi:hypothetical protein